MLYEINLLVKYPNSRLSKKVDWQNLLENIVIVVAIDGTILCTADRLD